MLPKRYSNWRYSLALVLGYLVFYTAPAYADITVPDALTMLQNLSQQVPSLMRLLTAIAYVMGMYFIIIGIMRLKHFGESRTMMSQEHTLKEPTIYILIGALLLYLPTSVQIGLSTFWTNPNPYAYQDISTPWMSFLTSCLTVIQLFGVLAFIRGLIIWSHLAGRGGHHQASFGRGLTHIIGGIFCINIYQVVLVIAATLGINYSS